MVSANIFLHDTLPLSRLSYLPGSFFRFYFLSRLLEVAVGPWRLLAIRRRTGRHILVTRLGLQIFCFKENDSWIDKMINGMQS